MTNQIKVRLPKEIIHRLEVLSEETGDKIEYHVQEAVHMHLEYLEDIYFQEAIEKREMENYFRKETAYVKKIIEHEEGPWFLLKLPNGQWAAFWYAGLNNYHAEAVFNGDYDVACSFVGEKKETVEHILKQLDLDNQKDPLNYCYNIEKIRRKLMRGKIRN